MAAEALLEGELDAIVRTLITKAKEGDGIALRLCVERLVPTRRDRTVAFELPEIRCPSDVSHASAAVLAACSAGALLPEEATKVMGLIAAHAKNVELAELDSRVAALEQMAAGP